MENEEAKSKLMDFINKNPNKTTVSVKQIKQLLDLDIFENNNVVYRSFEVPSIKKYDIVLYKVGPCKHFCVVIKVFKEDGIALLLSITSKTKFKLLVKLNESRQFPGSYMTLLPIEAPIEEIRKSFIGIYESKKEIDTIIKFSKDAHKELVFSKE